MTRLSSWFFGGLGLLALSNVECGGRTGLLDGIQGTTHGARPDGGEPDGGDAGRPAHDGDGGGDDAGDDDGGGDDATSGDASASDTGPGDDDGGDDSDGGGDDAADSGPPLQPDERVAGAGAAIVGVTDHGLIIYGDAAGTCWALPFAPGLPRVISPAVSGPGPCATGLHGNASISHDVVFMTIGTSLYAWTAAVGTPAPLPLATVPGDGAPTAVASNDSRYVSYGQGDLTSGFATVSVANVDGSHSQVLGEGALLFDGPLAIFGLGVDGPWMPNVPVIALDPANGWSRATVTPAAEGFAVDALGQNAIFLSDNGLTLTSLDGTTQTLVGAPPQQVTSLYLAPDASFAACFLTGGPLFLETFVLPGGAPHVVALPDGFDELSPESMRMQTPAGPVGAFSVSAALYVMALEAGSTFVPVLLPDTRIANDYQDGDGFTADGAFVLALAWSAQSTTRFGAVPLAGDPTPVYLTQYGHDARALTGSRVLYHDLYMPSGGLAYQGTADLRLANLANATTSSLVVPNVDAYVGLSPDRSQMAYTINRGTSDDGLYVMTLPTTP